MEQDKKLEIRNKLNKLWENVSAIDKKNSIRNPTPEENEEGSKTCEEFCNIFPVMFPERTLTRKMVEMSMVMPRFIRADPGLLYKILCLEQRGVSLHATMNKLERKYKSTKRKQDRYWQMLTDYENKMYA